MEDPKKAAAKPRPKHLVLDAEALELFNKAFNLTGEATEKQAVRTILTRFCELNELTDVHHPDDLAEIERLKKSACDKVNCELNAELTRVNQELNELNTRLNAELTQVKTELTDQQNELNEAGKKLTAASLKSDADAEALAAARGNLERTFGRLHWLLLRWCAARLVKEQGKAYTPEQLLYMLFAGYIEGKVHVFTKPNGRVIEEFKNRIKTEQDGAAKQGETKAE